MITRLSRRRFLWITGAVGASTASGALVQYLLQDDGTSPPSTAGTPVPIRVVDGEPDGYVVVAPRVLRAGQAESVSLALFRGHQLAAGDVSVALLQNEQAVAEASGQVTGRGSLPLQLPTLAAGDYTLRVTGPSFQDQAVIRVEEGTLVFVETDKPIYKPGQTVHIRTLALDPALKPVGGEAIVDAMDAKGITVFKKTVATDAFGMATVDLPLSTDPNLGVWKVRATVGQRSSQTDVRVERYVLPKYEVKVALPQSWALASEPITGTVAAEYSFGKPVRGEVEIVASRYVGAWEEYAHVTHAIDGARDFEVPAVGYAAGAPAQGGLATVQLQVTVREQATGYEEQTTQLVTIAASPVTLQLIPENNTFKPGLPFGVLVIAQTPDGRPGDADVDVRLTWQGKDFQTIDEQTERVAVGNGVGKLTMTPPKDAALLMAQATAPDAAATQLRLRAGYSPSGTFIHLEQVSPGPLTVGDTAQFKVSSTRQATHFYYEVLGRGTVVFSDVSTTPELGIALTPLMAPEARLLVYQVLPNGEVAADYLPFTVEGDYPQGVQLALGQDEVRPGAEVEVQVETEGPAWVGLAAVDRSVFILAENRLNLQQVFAELERLFLRPQAELHDFEPVPPGDPVPAAPPQAGIAPMRMGMLDAPTATVGAKELFQEAGVVVLTNRRVPEGQPLEQPEMRELAVDAAAVASDPQAATDGAAATPPSDGLAEVERVRQFFPETWLWTDLTTDDRGRAVQQVTAPDSITTWMFRAVALSQEHGLGIAEAQLRVFQPFFAQIDLPYATIRGEEFPVNVALYNYQPTAQEFAVELDAADWFDALDARQQSVTVPPNEVGAVAFRIRPNELGTRPLKVTARSRESADAIIKELLVEPEGVPRELVENAALAAGNARDFDLAIPPDAIPGSARAHLALTGNVLSQTIKGLEDLLQMPYGCGEQNMILFAPNVFITRYLRETRQLKPEIMAKAELMMLTGYQRELIYRRDDGSFSAFGQQDSEGSLWLTAFVLKTFAQAQDLIFIDESVLSTARDWIGGHQNADGSFDPVGFVHHQELLGGLRGKTALTAFVAIALREAGDDGAAASAVRYLEHQLSETDDAYTLALLTYALALADSGQAGSARDRLMALARESEAGLFWGDEPEPVVDEPPRDGVIPLPGPDQHSTAIEATGYATLALLEQGDLQNASRAVRWLAAQRNAFGGFGSTQDTIVALQAMSSAAVATRADIDATVVLRAGDWQKEVRIAPDNAEVLQVVEVPVGETLTAETRGRGQAMAQVVRRFNLPAVEASSQPVFQLDVHYDADQVEVDDRIDITATIRFIPPEPVEAGMVVLDVAVPTGFAPVGDSVDTLVQREPKLKRWEQAGRKVIFYIEDMRPDEELTLTFEAQALYPVRAQAVTSQVYAYYRREWKGESLGGQLTVSAKGQS